MAIIISVTRCATTVPQFYSGFNRGFSIFFNIDKLLLCFIKLCKCAHKYKKNIIFF